MAERQDTEIAEPEELDDEQRTDGESAAPALDPEVLARREAALGQLVKIGDPVLNSRASPITEFDRGLGEEVERMVALMHDAMGVGLAATQLGILRRLLVFQAGAEAEPTAVVNPEVEWLSEEVVVAEEGCLSIPRVTVDVERPLHARVSGRNPRGEPLLIEASGLEARVLQHEIDHLDGVLMLDRTTREQRKGALRAIRDGEEYSPPTTEADEALQGEAATAA
ncbi:MAG: peptide deformylase [Solirubrobacterales bacterium]